MCKNNNFKGSSSGDSNTELPKNVYQWFVSSAIFMVALLLYAPVSSDVKMNLAIIIVLIIMHKSQVVIKIDTVNKAIVAYIAAILFLLWMAF